MPNSSQPNLPPEGQYSDLERMFIEESPPRLWPANQDSNFGLVRKTITGPLQNAADILSQLFSEMFVATTSIYFTRWEDEFGLPKGPEDLTQFEHRRFWLKNRATRSPFTRTRRKALVEEAIIETFGPAIQLLPAGVPIPSEGIPIYSGEYDVHDLYRIDEEIEAFHYRVFLKPSIGVPPGLVRELGWMTPSGISFEVLSFLTTFPDVELFPDTNRFPNI